jgi:mono/diheme cytochrome c family protein
MRSDAMMSAKSSIAALTLSMLPPAVFAAAPSAIDFNRDVRPIFSENCFACHGPDTAKRKAGLRLDEKDSAFGKAESGERAIVPGDLEHSELLRRIASSDKDDQMPPPKEHKRLKPEQVELLRHWIQEGAPWQGHWAFQPVKVPALPALRTPHFHPRQRRPRSSAACRSTSRGCRRCGDCRGHGHPPSRAAALAPCSPAPHHEAQVAGRCTATLRAACRFDRLKARSLPRGGRRCRSVPFAAQK